MVDGVDVHHLCHIYVRPAGTFKSLRSRIAGEPLSCRCPVASENSASQKKMQPLAFKASKRQNIQTKQRYPASSPVRCLSCLSCLLSIYVLPDHHDDAIDQNGCHQGVHPSGATQM